MSASGKAENNKKQRTGRSRTAKVLFQNDFKGHIIQLQKMGIESNKLFVRRIQVEKERSRCRLMCRVVLPTLYVRIKDFLRPKSTWRCSCLFI